MIITRKVVEERELSTFGCNGCDHDSGEFSSPEHMGWVFLKGFDGPNSVLICPSCIERAIPLLREGLNRE